MGVGAGLYMYDVVVKKFTFAISSPDEFLCVHPGLYQFVNVPARHDHTLDLVLSNDHNYAVFTRG